MDDHWLTRAGTIKALWIAFVAVLAAVVLIDPFITQHPYFGLEGTFAFAAWFGFASCVAMILFASVLGRLLKRPDTYYDE
jgi:hypothetical protein